MADQLQPIIVIKKKKKGGHPHHGGAWKVAYADFVTAMMAFFLLMWLMNVTTADQRQGIADYFAPMGISQSFGGSGGVMGGTSISSPNGAEISSSSPPGVDEYATATVGKGDTGDESVPGKSEQSGGKPEEDGSKEKMVPKTQAEEDAMIAEAMHREEERFQKAEESLRQAIQSAPELRDLAQHLIIDRTPEGLRVQIIDQDKFSLFPSGSSIPYEKGRDLLRTVGAVLSRLTNQIAITGHTDSNPFVVGSRRDNWSLSTERANVSRSELQMGGVADNRISRVVGLSDRDPLVRDDPKDARNRRISIVLLREAGKKPVAETPKNANEQVIQTKVAPPVAP